jgi:1,4-dihydroxy-2-naphthoate octaprenyltransferase
MSSLVLWVTNMNRFQAALGIMRAPFLVLTPSCVVLGLAAGYRTSYEFSVIHAALALIGGLAAHISVNAFNEYFDFQSGLDFQTHRTPFSGGSGTLPDQPGLRNLALAIAILSLLVIVVIGLYFLLTHGISMLILVGALGMLVIVVYTPWFTKSPSLTLIAPGLGFGTLMVTGSAYAMSGAFTWTALIASCVPFFLVNNLLLLNQFPDVEADRTVGRRHFPIVIGRHASAWIYGINLCLAYLAILIGIASGRFPWLAALGFLTVPLAARAFIGARRHATDIERLIPSLGANVAVNVLTPLLVAIGLFIA